MYTLISFGNSYPECLLLSSKWVTTTRIITERRSLQPIWSSTEDHVSVHDDARQHCFLAWFITPGSLALDSLSCPGYSRALLFPPLLIFYCINMYLKCVMYAPFNFLYEREEGLPTSLTNSHVCCLQHHSSLVQSGWGFRRRVIFLARKYNNTEMSR